MILCNRICQVPPLLTESQQTIWCPDCDECNCGTCSHLTPTGGDSSRHIDASSLLAAAAAMSLAATEVSKSELAHWSR